MPEAIDDVPLEKRWKTLRFLIRAAGQGIDVVRLIRNEIRRRVEELIIAD
jgi:hypothetical protein